MAPRPSTTRYKSQSPGSVSVICERAPFGSWLCPGVLAGWSRLEAGWSLLTWPQHDLDMPSPWPGRDWAWACACAWTFFFLQGLGRVWAKVAAFYPTLTDVLITDGRRTKGKGGELLHGPSCIWNRRKKQPKGLRKLWEVDNTFNNFSEKMT